MIFHRHQSTGKNLGEDSTKAKDAAGKEIAPKEEHSVADFKVKQATSSAAPAPFTHNSIEPLLKKDNKPYIPKLKHERLSYEYPGLPNQDEFQKYSNNDSVADRSLNSRRWRRHLPKVAIFVVVLWAGYSIKVWVYEPETGSTSNDILSPDEFHPFVITHKEQIDAEHYLVEIKPKFDHWEYAYANNYEAKSIWNGSRMWSIEVKQPQIMVVRSYTPLPLYYLKSELTRSGKKQPLLKVVNNDEEDCDKHGTMVLYVKRYGDGEVSKYITDKEVGDEIEIRGPHIEFKMPYHPIRDSKSHYERPIFRDLPSTVEMDKQQDRLSDAKLPPVDNLTFYAAGTGIAPALQILMSRKPYEGFVNVHYSAQKPGELKPLERFMFFLEKLDRANFEIHYDINRNQRLSVKDVKTPEAPNYVSELRKQKREENAISDAADSLKLRMQILDDDNSSLEEVVHLGPRYLNALAQAEHTLKEPKKESALAVVCGPSGYVDYVCGAKNDVEFEQGPVTGLLGKKGWDNTNVYKL